MISRTISRPRPWMSPSLSLLLLEKGVEWPKAGLAASSAWKWGCSPSQQMRCTCIGVQDSGKRRSAVVAHCKAGARRCVPFLVCCIAFLCGERQAPAEP